MIQESINFFQTKLLQWFKSNGRTHLPWFNQPPYKVWLSEIMLQQTQVTTVIPYFHKFIETFPTIADLAHTSEEHVCQLWAGLGYYHRARNLHRTACIIHEQYHGEFPKDLKELQTLPGIGPSTAAAIASLAFNLPHAIFDGNVKRVLARYFGIETEIDKKSTLKELEQLAHACMPHSSCQSYTQAIMDMGATCCLPKNPQCHQCPFNTNCKAYLNNKTFIIPIKSKKKPKPMITYHYLALYNANSSVLMIKRPPKGIWPHLWCFPELDEIKQNKGDIEIRHELTHQSMDIHIHLKYENINKLEGIWANESNFQELGLPKPILVALPKIFLALKSPSHFGHQVAPQQQPD